MFLLVRSDIFDSVSDLVKVVRLDPKFSICTGSFHHWTDMQLLKKNVNLNQYSKDLELSHKVFPPHLSPCVSNENVCGVSTLL
jgi:hypothetical protein